MLRLYILSIAALVTAAAAQAPPAAPDEPITLHAYSNLVQVPVLVLTDKRLRQKPLTPDQFRLSIDSGPLFQPRRVRQEGTDPIRLVLLLDATPTTRAVLEDFRPALRDLAVALDSKDEISISVLHGNSLTQSQEEPLTPSTVRSLSAFVEGQMQTAAAMTPSPFGKKARTPRLWDAARIAMDRFGTTRSRRVLVLVTDGKDEGSKTTLAQLGSYMDSLGITVFALREQTSSDARWNEYVLNRDSFGYAPAEREGLDPLVTLTDMTGGLTLETRGHPLGEGLIRIVRLVRERYIVDFVRPSKLPAGTHALDVHVKEKHIYVRWAGIGVAMPDPAVLNDPKTVPSDPTAEPPVGTRRILSVDPTNR